MNEERICENLIRINSEIEAMMIGRLDGLCMYSTDKTLKEFRDRLKRINSTIKLMREEIEAEGITR